MFLIISSVDVNAVGSWTQVASNPGVARHRSSAFALGNKGYFGGGHINSFVPIWYQDWWQYDPATDSWTQIADYGGGPHYHSSSFVIDEFAYVGLGENELHEYTNEFWRYIPQINIWEPVAIFPGVPRRGASSFAINNMGFVGCGQTNAGYATDFFRYDPSINSWFQVADFIGEARSSAVAFSNDGKGYIGTGHIWGDDVKDFYEYDPSSNSWTQKADVPGPDRQDATGFVLNGFGYIGTGNDVAATDNFDDFWKYDFANDTWTQIEDFEGAARRYMVSFVIDNIAYCGGGTDGTNLKDFWRYSPYASIGDMKDNYEISVYPNPSVDRITIQIKDEILSSNCLQLIIYNIQGQEILSKLANKSEVTIDKEDIGSGQYVLILTTVNKILHTEKISFI